MALRSAIIIVMTAAARKAARNLLRDFGEVENLQVSKKGPADFVSAADRRAEEILHRELSRARPDFGFLMEERGAIAGADGHNRWIVDPLDGTVNYVHRHAHVSISIAYAEDGLVQVGVVYCPFREETFSAMKGKGSWRNNVKLQVSDQTEIKRALISTGFPHDRSNIDPLIRKVRALVLHCQDIRRLGSPALEICWVADGRLDGVYETLFPWDIAAACLVAEEAGATKGHLGQVPSNIPVDLYGQDIVVATPHIFRPLVRLLKGEA